MQNPSNASILSVHASLVDEHLSKIFYGVLAVKLQYVTETRDNAIPQNSCFVMIVKVIYIFLQMEFLSVLAMRERQLDSGNHPDAMSWSNMGLSSKMVALYDYDPRELSPNVDKKVIIAAFK